MSGIRLRHRLGWINSNTIGIILIVVTLGGSLLRVLHNRQELAPSGKIVLRICHWQLEGTYRLAMQTAIDDYEALHPNVHIIQLSVMQSVYSPWSNTHLISGDAPDIAELGGSKLTSNDQYTVRFYRSLGDVLSQPNPYNRGTSLETTPWKETFVDGMRGGYSDVLQDYFKIPTTTFVWRLFYNRNLVRQVTGSDQPPQSFGQLMDVCEKLKHLPRPRGEEIQPIVSINGPTMFRNSLCTSFTAGMEKDLDTDLSGDITDLETYGGFVSRKWDMHSKPVSDFYACIQQLCKEFPEGFAGMDRQTAMFTFCQQRAGFIITGSWDALSISSQAGGNFSVGVMEFPIPAPGEPWGDTVIGRCTEATSTGGSIAYGVCKTCRYQVQALDFLQFLTAQQRNGRYMAIAGWPPIIIGSPTSDAMKPFVPDIEGYLSYLELRIGTQVSATLDQQEPRFLQGEIGYDEFAKQYEEAMRDPRTGGDRDWAQRYDDMALQCRGQEQILAMQSLRSLMDPSAADAPMKFRRLLLQQARKNNGLELKARFEAVRGVPIPTL